MSQEISNFHIISVKHIPETNQTACGIRIHSDLFNQMVRIPYTNEPGEMISCAYMAMRHIYKLGFNIVGKGESKDGYYLIVNGNDKEGFLPLKPIK